MRLIEQIQAQRSTPAERRTWTVRLVGSPDEVTLRVQCYVQRRPSGRGRWPARWELESPLREVPGGVRTELRVGLMRQINLALNEALGVEP